jgi:hypothetical protein
MFSKDWRAARPAPKDGRHHHGSESLDRATLPAVLNQLTSAPANQRLVEALAEAQVPFIVIGGVAVQFHFPERVPDDLDIVVARTVEAGQRLLEALAAVGHPGHFTAEEYAQGERRAGFPLKPPKSVFNADVFRAEPWFNFEERWSEAHDALLLDTPVKVASKRALIMWIEHAENLKPKHLRDLELLRGAAGE